MSARFVVLVDLKKCLRCASKRAPQGVEEEQVTACYYCLTDFPPDAELVRWYVARLYFGTFQAQAWTKSRTEARLFSHGKAVSVAKRNRAKVVAE